MSASATPEPVIRQIVDAMRTLAGPHPGFRPVHAKGLVCSGTFRASADAPRIPGRPISPVHRCRPSSGSPIPTATPRCTTAPPACARWRSSSSSPTARAPTSSPTRSRGSSHGHPRSCSSSCARSSPSRPPAGPTPTRVPRFLASHPAGRGFVERLMKRPVPASYAQVTYYAEHAFRFTAADGTSRFGRYRFVPQAGEAFLSPDDAGKRSASFLSNELDGRLRTGPVAFRLLLQVADAGTRRTTSPRCGPRGGPRRAGAPGDHRITKHVLTLNARSSERAVTAR